MKRPFYLLLGLIILVPGCQKIFNKPNEINSLDIVDAIYLGVDESADFLSGAKNNLYKITINGGFDEPELVCFIDDSDNLLDETFIYAETWDIIPATERYSILWGEYIFNLKGGETRSLGLLLDNQTGALYDMHGFFFPYSIHGYMGSKYYQTDKNGNIYYYSNSIFRIIVSDKDNIQLEKYVDALAGVSENQFFVSNNGDVFFDNGKKVKVHTGGILETNMDLICFRGFQGQTYAFQNESFDEQNILLLEVDGNGLKTQFLRKSNFIFDPELYETVYIADSLNSRHIFKTQRGSFGSISFGEYTRVGLVFNESDLSLTPIVVDNKLYGSFTTMEDSYMWMKITDHKYIAHNLKNITIDIPNNRANVEEYKIVEIPSNFNVSDFLYNREQGINFIAYDLETETEYRCKITVERGFECLESNSLPGKLTLTRIN